MNREVRAFAAGLIRLLAVLLAVGVFTGTATADPLQGATVDFKNNEGTLTGFFQLDTTLQTPAVTAWDLTTSAFNCGNPVTCESSGFPQIEYTQGNSTVDISPSFGFQAITFTFTLPDGTHSVLSFVMDCGGNNNDCIGGAADGSTIPLASAGESRAIVPIARALSLASLEVTDPPGVLSFNVVSAAAAVPEPATALLLAPVLGGLMLLRRRRKNG